MQKQAKSHMVIYTDDIMYIKERKCSDLQFWSSLWLPERVDLKCHINGRKGTLIWRAEIQKRDEGRG